MDRKYWEEKWKAGDIRFHQSEINPHLKKHSAYLQPGPVFVPLCGKSKDLIWLNQQGLDVVGVELSPIACEAFFSENGLSYQKFSTDGFSVYQGDQATLWCGDFFSLPPRAFEKAKSIYDRAALIALPKDLRKKYSEKIIEIVSHSSIENILLIVIEYPQEKVDSVTTPDASSLAYLSIGCPILTNP